MNKSIFTYFKENKVIFLSTLIVLFLTILSFIFINYNSKENITKRNLNNISKTLNEINLSLSNAIKDLTIDTDSAKDILSNGIEDLNKSLLLLSETNYTSEEISLTKSNLETAINNTISLYDYNLSILSDTNNIKGIDTLDKFNLLKENCITSYSTLENNKIQVSFSENTLKYFNNFDNYINTLIKINKQSEFKDSQAKEFINKLQKYKNDITYLNEDLSIAINKVREDKRDLQVIIDDIYKKEDIYNSIKENISFISVPDGCMEIYNSLNEYLNSYYAYLNSIKEAVIYEKTATDKNKLSDEIDKNYKNANSKRNDALSSYINYENKI